MPLVSSLAECAQPRQGRLTRRPMAGYPLPQPAIGGRLSQAAVPHIINHIQQF
jgi:hypothetical protein